MRWGIWCGRNAEGEQRRGSRGGRCSESGRWPVGGEEETGAGVVAQGARTWGCRAVARRSVPAAGIGSPARKRKEGIVIDIDQEHPEYVSRKHVWRQYRDLYAGGEQLKIHAQNYLIRRQREPGDVYAERLSRVFYENY